MQLRVELDHVPATAQGVDAEVVGDSQEPGLEAVLRVEGLQAVIGAQEGLLYKIFHGGIAAGVGVDNPPHQPLVAADQLLVRSKVALFGALDQLVVHEARLAMASLFTRTILRLWTSIAPSRWNSPMTLETASRVEAIMFANSWCVRRTPRLVPRSSPSPRRSARFKSRVDRRAETSRCRRLSMTSSDCLRRSEKEEKSFMANSGRRFITSVKAAFWTPATSTSVTASAKTSCQRPSTKLSFPKTPTSLRSAVVASLKSP